MGLRNRRWDQGNMSQEEEGFCKVDQELEHSAFDTIICTNNVKSYVHMEVVIIMTWRHFTSLFFVESIKLTFPGSFASAPSSVVLRALVIEILSLTCFAVCSIK